MEKLFGIPLALDVGTFLGLVFAGVTAAGLTRWARDRVGRERREETARHLERVARERDEDAARREHRARQEQEHRRRQEQREEAYRAHKEALEIHESLTSLEVLEALGRARSDEDAVATDFLQATYRRSQSRYLAFKDSADLPDQLDTLVEEALGAIAALYPQQLGEEQQQVATTRQDRRDRTRYSWDGDGSHSKIWTINLIAERWASTHGLTTVAAFVESFGAELRAAVPDRADEFTPAWLLTTTHDEKYGARDTYLASTPLVLDGTEYGVHWRCGFKNHQIGTGVHRPVIEHFIRKHGFPAVAL